MARVVWVYQRTGSGVGVAGAVLFEIVRVIAMAPLAAVVIDRLPRKWVLVVSDVPRAANGVSWSTGRLAQIRREALAGGIMAAVGQEAAFVLNAATLRLSAFRLARLPTLAGHRHALGAPCLLP